jgi:4-amino-4-deoxy-L-arabinose transferase-like glycosyltransferase
MIKKLLKNEFFWLTLIVFVTIFLRLYRLTEIPPGLTGDEAWTGIDTLEILKNGYIGPYIPIHAWGQMSGYLYYQTLIFKIFGISFFTLRLGGAIIGIFTIIAFYFLAKLFFKKEISLLITFLFSIAHWHLHFSHMSFFLIAVPFFSITSFYFLIRGFRDKKIFFFALGGICLGLGLNTYFSFFFSTLAIIIFIIYKTIAFGIKKKLNKKILQGILIFGFSSLVIFLPLGIYISKNPDVFFGRNILTSPFFGPNKESLEIKYGPLSNSKIVFLNIKKTLLMFHYQGDENAIDNLPGQPMIDRATGLLMLAGLFLALKKIKEEKYFLAIVWFLTALIPGFLTAGAPNARRTIDSLPSVFLFSGFILEFLELSLKRFNLNKKMKRIILALIFAVIAIVSFWENLNVFFVKYPKESSAKFWFAYNQVKMCEYLNNNYQNHYVYFFSDFWSWNYETRRFLCPNIQGENVSKSFADYVLNKEKDLENKQKSIYIILTPYEKYSTDWKKLYNGSWKEVRDIDGQIMFVSYLKND